jgi:hypothetical protein
MVVLARLGSAELAAIVGGVLFLLIMCYLLFGGATEKQPKQPKPRR